NSLVLNTNEPSGQQLFICRDIGGGTLQWQLINDDAATTAADHAYTDSQVAAEASARTSADAAETSARQAADATLQSNIDSEVSRAQAAEAAEAAARAAADSAETTARQAFDMAGADGSNQPTLFRWQVNNTGLLNLFTATSGNPAQDSGLKIGSDGKITFAAGQTFPGTQNTLTAGTGISILSNTISNTG